MLELLDSARPYLVVVMVVLFSAIVLWAYSPRRRDRMKECGNIPLRDDR
jgi:cbb3-type cytochrome oxidase subunit 3